MNNGVAILIGIGIGVAAMGLWQYLDGRWTGAEMSDYSLPWDDLNPVLGQGDGY